MKPYKVRGKKAIDVVKDSIAKTATGKITPNKRSGETLFPHELVKENWDPSTDFAAQPPTIDSNTGEVTVVLTVINVQIEATMKTILPQWANENSAPQVERDLWNNTYLAALSGYEKEHSDDIATRLTEYRDSLIGITGTGKGPSRRAASLNSLASIRQQAFSAKTTLFLNTNADARARHVNNGHTLIIH